ncbi:MAG: hypothetical protein KKB20_03370, partial [Proteobacteria bacterium]|nr:hypothetical protein [Pseudomonadota bacterium]
MGRFKVPAWMNLGLKARLLIYSTLVMVVLGLFDGPLFQAVRVFAASGVIGVRLGYWMGHGLVLAVLLAGLYLFGRQIDRPRLMAAARDGLMAFVLSGLAAQLLKHLVGRPRPRLWVQGVVHWGPSLKEGLDS